MNLKFKFHKAKHTFLNVQKKLINSLRNHRFDYFFFCKVDFSARRKRIGEESQSLFLKAWVTLAWEAAIKYERLH